MLIEFTIFGALFFVCVAIRSLCESIRDEMRRNVVALPVELSERQKGANWN